MTPLAPTTLADVVRSTGGVIQTGPFGSQLHASDYKLEGTPLVMPTNLRDNQIDPGGIARVGHADVKRLSRHKLRPGDIVFSRRGDVGRRALVGEDERGWLCGTGCLAVRFGRDLSRVSPAYIAHLVGEDAAQSWLFENAVGATMPNLNTKILGALPLVVPTKVEQDRVVRALDDAGALVGGIVSIIDKKRDINIALAQQLLTGQTRLPGFGGSWRTLRVAAKSHLKARIGWQGLTTEEYRWSGEHRLVGGAVFRRGRVDWGSSPFVDKWRFDQDTNIQLRIGDVLLTKDGTIGKVAFVDMLPGPTTLNSGVFVIRPRGQAYDSAFLYCVLTSRIFEEFVAGLSAGSTINHLYQRDLVTLALRVPADITEQRAISRVLFDADAEIVALERRLRSARAVQQGMMQQLLRGRTRLVDGDLA